MALIHFTFSPQDIKRTSIPFPLSLSTLKSSDSAIRRLITSTGIPLPSLPHWLANCYSWASTTVMADPPSPSSYVKNFMVSLSMSTSPTRLTFTRGRRSLVVTFDDSTAAS